ncbi:MAG: DedA family protein [Bacteroidota bacterium]|nr:DedA family protein [Candidatus Kapabacteria bacterium]MCX7936408.1 DedA family protein [Chlorobiota bacterium]MDW8074312.1 DedA family protein [Bacteroidota bacterium]
MLDHLVAILEQLPPWGIAVAAFAVTYLENILPPSPSDVLLVFIGTLIGIGTADFGVIVLFATLGSTAGFFTMFTLGRVLGDRLMTSQLRKLFPLEAVERAEQWFQRWGYIVIVINRFLSGTRSVISLFAGMSHLEPVRTTILCGVSALVWNTLLLYAGMQLGQNWRTIEAYFRTYGIAITIILAVAAIIGLIVYVFGRIRAARRHRTNQ